MGVVCCLVVRGDRDVRICVVCALGCWKLGKFGGYFDVDGQFSGV